ncbi:MAG: OB-fold domain-containing protein [Burkholderiaceae bacterium]|nr:OB-fold domain-containing protein [Burkholderiaceae bacterium]
MSYLPTELPAPTPEEDDAPFWAHCNERRLMFQQCPQCGTLVHPPLPVCPGCQSLERAWVQAPAQAQLFSFTWVHTAAHESVKPSLPYNVAVVEFPEMPGVRLISNVIDTERGALRVGDRLTLAWEQGWEGQMLPRFRQLKDAT